MIYLIRLSGTKVDQISGEEIPYYMLKIGYTKDKNGEKRFNSYKSNNPGFKLLYTIPDGTLKDEKNLHKYFKEYNVYRYEWYDYDQKDLFIDFFKTHTTSKDLEFLYELVVSESDLTEKLSDFLKDNINIIFNIIKSLSPTSGWGIEQKKSLLAWLSLKGENGIINNVLEYLNQTNGNDFGSRFMEEFEKIQKKKQEHEQDIIDFKSKYESFGSFEDRLRFICTYSGPLDFETDIKYLVDEYYIEAINLFGLKKLKAVCYKKCYVNEMLQLFNNQDPIRGELYDLLEVGKRYTARYIKDELIRLYRKYNIKSTPKATYIREYFDIKEVFVTVDKTGKQQKGYLILNKKS